MIESSPQLSESPIHDDHVDQRKSGASFGLRAACFILGLATLVLASMVYQENATVASTRTQLTQATDEGTQAKSDLDKANVKVADMQGQLTAATAKATDLQTQLAKAQGQSKNLQAQLVTATNQASDMKAQLASANDRLAEAQAKVSQANDSSALLRKQLDASKAQVADLQAQVEKAQPKNDSAQASAPLAAMPVAATFEKSFWTGDYTLHIKNTNSDPLNVTVTVAGSQAPAPITATIKGGATFDVKKLAGGANVNIASDGFGPVSLTAH